MKVSPRMLAVLIFAGGLSAIAYQVYQLNEVRLGIRDLRPEKTAELRPALPDEVASKKSGLSLLRPLHLMGDPEASKKEPVLDTQKVVDTDLKLELVGTIRGTLGDRDSALIQVKGKETKRYYIGDVIEGGAQLDSVNEDVVMLKRAGALETLRYSKSEVGAANDVVNPGAQNNARSQPRQKQPVPVSAPSEQESQPENAVTDEAAEKKPVSLRQRLKGRNKPLTPLHAEPN